jgi:hypothetical protein
MLRLGHIERLIEKGEYLGLPSASERGVVVEAIQLCVDVRLVQEEMALHGQLSAYKGFGVLHF